MILNVSSTTDRLFLKKRLLSDVVKEGAIFDLCKSKFPWCGQVTLNKNVQMKPHFDKNVGLSAICFFSPHETFRGGGLATEAHHFVEPGVWHFLTAVNSYIGYYLGRVGIGILLFATASRRAPKQPENSKHLQQIEKFKQIQTNLTFSSKFPEIPKIHKNEQNETNTTNSAKSNKFKKFA